MPTKIFIGNLGSNCRSEDLRELFEKYGKVTECDVLKNFGFVVCPLLRNGNWIGLAKFYWMELKSYMEKECSCMLNRNEMPSCLIWNWIHLNNQLITISKFYIGASPTEYCQNICFMSSIICYDLAIITVHILRCTSSTNCLNWKLDTNISCLDYNTKQ